MSLLSPRPQPDPATRQITPNAYGRATNRPARGGSLSRHAYAGVEQEPALAEVKGRSLGKDLVELEEGVVDHLLARHGRSTLVRGCRRPGFYGPRDWRNRADAEMAPPVS